MYLETCAFLGVEYNFLCNVHIFLGNASFFEIMAFEYH